MEDMTPSLMRPQALSGVRIGRIQAASLCLFVFSTPAAAFEMPTSWVSTHFTENALVGTIWTGSGAPVEPSAFAESMAGADYVLAGETHDNADHHLLQARFIEAMTAAGQKPAIVFEMIPTNMQPAVDALLADPPSDASAFGAALQWAERGWPDFAIYRPIVEAAMSASLSIRAGDLPRETIRSIGRDGVGALSPADAERLSLSGDLPSEEVEELSSTLKESHCGMLPDAAIAPMLTVQRARDGALADATSRAASEAGGGKAVLIAGAGHTRKDWAVPSLLSARFPDAAIVSIALMEVSEDADEPSDYGLGREAPAPYDYVLFTPRGNVSDPCEAMAEAMGQAQGRSKVQPAGETKPAE